MEAETSLLACFSASFVCCFFYMYKYGVFILNILYESYQYLPLCGVLYYLTGNFKNISVHKRFINYVSVSLVPAIICMVLADLAFRSLNRGLAQIIECVFFSFLNAASQSIAPTDALIHSLGALNVLFAESDKFYIYLKVLVPICMSEKTEQPTEKEIT